MNIFTDHPKPKVKIGVLFLKRKRAGFVPEWGDHIEGLVRGQLKNSPFDVFIPEGKVVDGISMRQAMKVCEDKGCQVYIALQPTMSDGRMAPVLAQHSRAPVVFWATPEKQEGSMISACSLVGAHTFTATLAQTGHPFEFVYGMPGEAQTVRDFSNAVYRAYAYSLIRNGSAGLVGYHAPGFIDMHVDPASMKANLHTELFHISMHEFIDSIHAVSDEAAKADLKKMKQLGLLCEDDISEADLLLSSKYYLCMKEMMDTLPLNALSVRDWPELSSTQWPYLAMARLSSEGYAVACEGDTDGALSCLLGYAVGCGACYLSDWLEHDEHHITLWHGGAAPFQMCQGLDSKVPPKIARHFNNRNPAVVDATLKSGMPITLFRLWHLNGKYLFTAIEGETVEPKRHLKGTNGTGCFDSVDINDYFIRMVKAGFPHHPVIAEGHVKKHLYALMENLGIECKD
ncbi:MAG: sugar isomerase [Kiritimatiellaceae bacterium]|nr:sugar isomerase [Kiritimatiellaceae bacterium]